MRSGFHLLIVDLLPPRRHDPGGLCNAAFEAMGGEPFPLPADRPLCVAAYRVVGPGRVDLYAEPLGVGAPMLPDVPLFFDPDHYVNVPMESTYDAAWQATPRRWRDVLERRPADGDDRFRSDGTARRVTLAGDEARGGIAR